MCRKEERMHYARILAETGHTQAEIGKRLGVSDRMVRKYLRKDFGTSPRKKRTSKLDPFKATVDRILEDDPLYNIEVLAQSLRNQGYSGGMTILRDYAAVKRKAETLKAVLRFETEPGLQAQVDWKECGRWIIDGAERKLYAFVMLLGYSRRPFVLFTTNMRSPTLLAAHLEAFASFGGVPREILYDNMKTAWLSDGDGWRVHPALLSLAGHCGFEPKRCRVRRPQTKGKVERFIRHLAHNFLPLAKQAGCGSLDELNAMVRAWIEGIDDKQVGGLRETRKERFARERYCLLPYRADMAPDVRESVDLVVSREGTVRYETNAYSVPAGLIGATILLRRDPLSDAAVLTHRGETIRELRLLPQGMAGRDIRPEDARSLRARWDKENRPKPRLKIVEKPVSKEDRGIETEVRHPSCFDLLAEVRA